MPDIPLERALLHRDRSEAPRLIARSPGLAESLLAPLTEIITAFGERPAGATCPGAIFAQPLGKHYVAIVHVSDTAPGPSGWAGSRFSALILAAHDYETLGGDPFAIARAVPGFWPLSDPALAEAIKVADDKAIALAPHLPPHPDDAHRTAFALPAAPLAPRGLPQVHAVLKRIKSHALPENADPANPPKLTVENSESPMLLGAVQVLVDGGKLILERPKPDASVLEALWTLLPHSLRPRLWPASFAFTNDLDFDVLIVPRLSAVPVEGFTTEEQAGDYPQGSYELALQTAAELGNAADLEAVFHRRTSRETLKLGFKLLIGLSLLVIAFRLLTPAPRDSVPMRAAAVAGIVGAQDPWMAFFHIDVGNRLFNR